MPDPGLVVAVDGDSPLPPHAQIREQIRAHIERGQLRPGDAVPPVRQLALDLGVAPNTVARAYADLRALGWLESERRKLTRVADGSSVAFTEASRRTALAQAVAHFLTSLASRGYAADEIAVELRTRLPAIGP